MDEIKSSGLAPKSKRSNGISSVTELATGAIDLYKENYKSYIGISLFILLSSVISLISVTFAGALSLIVNTPLLNLISVVIVVVLVFLMFVFQTWGNIALIYSIANKAGVKESLKKTWGRKILSYLWLGLLSGLAVAGGMLLFFVPGVVIGVYLSMTLYIFVVEDKKGVEALERSTSLVKGNTWGIVGRLLAMLVITFAVFIPVGALLGGENPSGFENLIQTVLNLLYMPFAYAYYYLIYKDLVKIKGSTKKESFGWIKAFIGLGVVALALLVGLIFFLIYQVMPSYMDSQTADYNDAMVKTPREFNEDYDAMRRSDIDYIRAALELYNSDFADYPGDISELSEEEYLLVLPKDPETKEPYKYTYLGDDYQICATLSDGFETCLSSPTGELDEELTPQL